jgi:hypothetical protein
MSAGVPCISATPFERDHSLAGRLEPRGEAFRALQQTGALRLECAGRAKQQRLAAAKGLGGRHLRGDTTLARGCGHLPDSRGQAAVHHGESTVAQLRLTPKDALEGKIGNVDRRKHRRKMGMRLAASFVSPPPP